MDPTPAHTLRLRIAATPSLAKAAVARAAGYSREHFSAVLNEAHPGSDAFFEAAHAALDAIEAERRGEADVQRRAAAGDRGAMDTLDRTEAARLTHLTK